jgi:hypothetical protein
LVGSARFEKKKRKGKKKSNRNVRIGRDERLKLDLQGLLGFWGFYGNMKDLE